MNQNQIERIAIKLANKMGLVQLTKDRLCFECGIPAGSFNHLMGCSFTEFVLRLYSSGKCKLGCPIGKARVNSELMRHCILEVAVKLSVQKNYKLITRGEIADELSISPSLVSLYFGDMTQLKKRVVEYAIETEELIIIAQVVMFKDSQVASISKTLRNKALKAVIHG
jgi:hypothetical protein